jgi:hypothetical protein
MLVYVVFRVREVVVSASYYKAMASIIEKFEARIAELQQVDNKSAAIRASEWDRTNI